MIATKTYRAVAEMVLQRFYSQGLKDNREHDEWSVLPFLIAVRDKLLHQILETGQVGRNYGSGNPGDLHPDLFTRDVMDVSQQDGVWGFTIPGTYADLRSNAGVVVVPVRGMSSQYIQVTYGYQFAGELLMNMENRTAWWVTPSGTIEFSRDPGPQVALLRVASLPDTPDIDAEFKYPPHLLEDIVKEAADLMGRPQPPDQSINNHDQKPS